MCQWKQYPRGWPEITLIQVSALRPTIGIFSKKHYWKNHIIEDETSRISNIEVLHNSIYSKYWSLIIAIVISYGTYGINGKATCILNK